MVELDFRNLFPLFRTLNSGFDLLNAEEQIPTNKLEMLAFDVCILEAIPGILDEKLIIFIKALVLNLESLLCAPVLLNESIFHVGFDLIGFGLDKTLNFTYQTEIVIVVVRDFI